MKYFYVLNIKDRNLTALIDGIRLIANPYIKYSAHITVRGPYDKKYNVSKINEDIIGSKIKIKGVGNFFEYSQNTVYLRCESDTLEKASFKKDYPDSYNPHITLYDGNNKAFSQEFYEILKKHNFCFNIYSSEMEPLQSRGVGGVKNDERFILRDEFYSNLSYYLNEKIDFNKILDLDNQSRLNLIDRLCGFFDKNPNPNAYYSPIQKIIDRLGLNEENGLFYYSDIRNWEFKLPYRVIRALKEIKPYAIHCMYKNDTEYSQHPKPFNQPYILFFDNPVDENKIHSQVFSFGQAPVVFIDRADSVEILNGYEFLNKTRKLKTIGDSSFIDYFTLENLIYGRSLKDFYSTHFQNVKRVDAYLLENISEVRNVLLENLNLSPSVANSLIGRLIFTRYLIDRGVIFKEGKNHFFEDYDKHIRNKFFVDAIRNKEKIYSFFDFLKNKLNGDLFPVTKEEIQEVNQEHLDLLHYLFKGGKVIAHGQKYSVQESLFDVYDFRVIPIELISNIYENFIGEVKRLQNKAFYTPSFLVDFILSQGISKHIENSDEVSCKVLDPSCGSGIFLIETLRKLIEKYKVNNSDNISDFQLWKLVQDNIFGIDIDSNAIDVAIFSLYVTILDYKEPKEISNSFKFKELKNVNFFPNADFFDINHPFNEIIKGHKLDFIIGNPPWGHVKKSCYIEYINLKKTENNRQGSLVDIGAKEISQAFLIRVIDFLKPKNNTKCTFIISSKAFYNTSQPVHVWRKFILESFKINQIFELSPVNNKIAGGYHIFEGARQPTAIISFELPRNKQELKDHVITHVSIKPHLNHKYFKSFIITNYDYKRVPQRLFNSSDSGFDWLWKVLLHGNSLDFEFIKRLKRNYKTLQDYEVIERPKEGIKYKDGNKSYSTEMFSDWKFLETDKVNSFSIQPDILWKKKAIELSNDGKINSNHNVGYIPNEYFFKGKKVIIREALTKDFNALCVYDEGNYLFNQSISAIKLKKEFENDSNFDLILKSIVGLYNSKLFTYFIFHTSSSAGVDRARAIINEFLSFPVKEHLKISELTIEIQNLYSRFNQESQNDLDTIKTKEISNKINNKKDKLDELIFDVYELDNIERSLVDYTINVSIPLLKRNEKVFRPLNLSNQKDSIFIQEYINIFSKKIKEKYGQTYSKRVVQSSDYIGVFFTIDSKEQISFESVSKLSDIINYIGEVGMGEIGKNLYYQKMVIGKENDSIYIIKPNEYKSWHNSLAIYDSIDFS